MSLGNINIAGLYNLLGINKDKVAEQQSVVPNLSSTYGQNQQPANVSGMFSPGSFLGKDGGLSSLIGGAQGLASIYLGNKQTKLAQDQYKTNTAFATTNLANSAKMLNTTLAARYAQTLAAKQGTGEQNQNLDEYMKQNSVSGSI